MEINVHINTPSLVHTHVFACLYADIKQLAGGGHSTIHKNSNSVHMFTGKYVYISLLSVTFAVPLIEMAHSEQMLSDVCL